ncbi:ATP-binding protein [Listeria ivanovii]|uniref:nSTAND3 domain-containing NTPase n=1 Tax=Listeria ivanovii TaxID=1638 RepID=UPI0005127324|nr:ATP-binding protein [Listeria ivanovii]AIS62345.1 hypothetical protein JL53_06250 [Listeria ivanovii subsp. londoniensis]MBK1965266.1 ATP-binding protein [Listeria ivanovii subsp. londoniensis]MBK1984720.1 ATP-binding protein [Listeria ivanovii subsp. londoniensis]MBK1994433.1 ATP-binding protein [Listeria ivanovii subsp. londoniensis]
MSKINEIQKAIIQLEGGAFQSLMDAYLYVKYGYSNISELGSHIGTNKTTKGSPDSFIRKENGKYILITYGTVLHTSYAKIADDIKKCLDSTKTDIDIGDIDEIIACHTSSRLTPNENKQLYELFKNITLVGIGEVAKDLYFYYQSLAKDHLGVGIDTDQILTVTEFYNKNAHSSFSTPLEMPLLGRNTEKDDLVEALGTYNLVLINGKAGVGKTRLALEVCVNYAKENNVDLKCVKQNGESIYDDLASHFIDNKNYLIFIDDANQLSQLSHLLDMAVDINRKYTMKLVLTVRDYATKKIEDNIKTKLFPYVYELAPLSSENIEQVIKENLGINNTMIVKRILDISSGSLRIAIMAGTCVNKKLFDQVKNVYEIYRNYYSDILVGMNKNHLIIASLIAFSDSMRLNSEHVIYQLAKEQGINSATFNEVSKELHELEVVDIFENSAIKFNEESFGNYLLYFVLYEKRWITIAELIDKTLLDFPSRLSYTISTLLSLFNNQDLEDYITVEIRKLWESKFKYRSVQDKWAFVKIFKYFIIEPALLFTKIEIDKLEKIDVDFLKYDFEEKSNHLMIKSDLMESLISYKYTDRFQDAIELAIYYMQHNNNYPMDFYFLFSKYWTIDKDSHTFNYQKETMLVNTLYQYYQGENDDKIAVVLISLIGSLLKFQFDSSNYIKNNKVEFSQYGLLDSKALLDLRKKCIEVLAVLYQNNNYKLKILNLLDNYSFREQTTTNLNIAIQDIVNIGTFLEKNLSQEKFDECVVLKYFFDLAERLELSNQKESFMAFQKNESFMLYTVLTRDEYCRKDWKKYKEIKDNELREIARTITEKDFINLIIMFKSKKISCNDWDFENNMIMLLLNLSNDDYFISCCEVLMEHNVSVAMNIHAILQKMMNIKGYDDSKVLIEKYSFQERDTWITTLFSLLNPEEMSKKRSEDIILLIDEQQSFSRNMLEVSVIMAANINNDHFAVDYLIKIIQKNKENLFIFPEFFIRTDTDEIEELYDTFTSTDRKNILADIYLLAIQDNRGHFDYDYKWFLFFYSKNKDILKQIIAIELREYRAKDSVLQGVWKIVDFKKVMNEIVTFVYENTDINFGKLEYIKSIFAVKDSEHKINNWILDYIKENATNIEMMKFIFSIICNLNYFIKKEAVTTFCKFNNSFIDFLKINILKTCWSWSGSEVPYIDEEILFIEELNKNLIGLDFIEHRNELSRIAVNLVKEKDRVLVKEFIEQR